jgi:23S rRNA pseudouridine2605 synthase
VTLDRELADDAVAKIRRGVFLKDGKARVDDIGFSLPSNKFVARVVLHSGKKRIIRRIFDSLGYKVKALDRIAYAGLPLKGLARGQWRHVSQTELLRLQGTGQQKNLLHTTKEATQFGRVEGVKQTKKGQNSQNKALKY